MTSSTVRISWSQVVSPGLKQNCSLVSILFASRCSVYLAKIIFSRILLTELRRETAR